jgi:class 3 adenylate cyclase
VECLGSIHIDGLGATSFLPDTILPEFDNALYGVRIFGVYSLNDPSGLDLACSRGCMNGTRAAGALAPLPSGMLIAMFTDIVDSTRIKQLMPGKTAARRDAAYRTGVKEPHDTRLTRISRDAGGRKVNAAGDGYLFAFTDAEEAVLCALAIQDSLRIDPIATPLGPLRLRIGMHIGVARPTDEDYTASMVDKAARIQSHAAPGEVLLSPETRAVVAQLRDVFFEETPALELKGLEMSSLFRVSRGSGMGAAGGTGRAGGSVAGLTDFENPYDFATVANHRTFKGRTFETEELLDSIATCTHTAIFGLQRMGKTSLITQGLQGALADHEALRSSILVATVDMQRLGGAQVTYRDFVHAIFEAIVEQLARLGLGREVQNLRALTRELFTANQYQRGDRTEFFSVLAKLLGGLATAARRRIVLFIDEFSEIRKVIERNKTALTNNPSRTSKLLPHDMYIDLPFIHHLSSLLKDEALKQQVTFVVIVRPFLAEYDEREGLQLLKLMKPISLRHLDHEAARELITRPLEPHVAYEEGAVDYLCWLTAGHPYLLQFMLKLIVDRIKRNGRATIALADVQWVQERMISNGPAYDAQFAVLISDYSIDEIMHPKEAQLGKGLLALVSKLGQQQEGWVDSIQIFEAFAKYKIPEEKTASILSQLTRTRILEEGVGDDESLRYRLSIPLVQERFVRQNLYRRFFRYA